jgi:hypothetical protein
VASKTGAKSRAKADGIIVVVKITAIIRIDKILDMVPDFVDRFAIVENKRSALDIVRMATMNKIGRFTKQDIREQCPSLSISSIESTLRKMVELGELKREGVGKNTCYYRL